MKRLLAPLLVVVLGTACAPQARNAYPADPGNELRFPGSPMGDREYSVFGYMSEGSVNKWLKGGIVDKQPTGLPLTYKESNGTVTTIVFGPTYKTGLTLYREFTLKNTSSPLYSKFLGHKTIDGTWLFRKVN